MKNRICLEIHIVLLHTMRLLLKKKETLFVFGLGLFFFFALLFTLDEAKEEKSVVFIGIADEDNTELSKKLTERISECEVFSVTKAPLKELLNLQKAGSLTAVFVIREGYETAVNAGREERLIAMYEAEGKGLPLLADIVAGEMMQDICTAKGFLTYEEVMRRAGRETELLSKEEYAAYVMDCLTKETFDFSFETEYSDRQGSNTRAPEQSVIYVQVIFSVLAILIGFLAVYAVLPYADFCHGRSAARVRALPLSKASVLVGAGGAAFLTVITFGTTAVVLLSAKNGLPVSAFGQMFLCTAAYSGGIVILTMAAATVIKSRTGYQLFLLFLIVVFGAAGFLSVADGLLVQSELLRIVPNSVYVKAMIRCYIGR
ncbi:MAG: ABC transporter permease [Lachnospiraceae bacterium]